MQNAFCYGITCIMVTNNPYLPKIMHLISLFAKCGDKYIHHH